MADILDFNGITKGLIDPQKILDGARGIDEVLLVGWKGDQFYMATSNGNIGDTLVLLELAKQQLMEEFG